MKNRKRLLVLSYLLGAILVFTIYALQNPLQDIIVILPCMEIR